MTRRSKHHDGAPAGGPSPRAPGALAGRRDGGSKTSAHLPGPLRCAWEVARGLFRGEIRLTIGLVQPCSAEDAEEIAAITLGSIAGACDVPDDAMGRICAAIERHEDDPPLAVAMTTPEQSLAAVLRSIPWSPPMLALFRCVAVHRVAPRLTMGNPQTGEIWLSSPEDAVLGWMRGSGGERAAFLLPAHVLPRPILEAEERERIAQALAKLLLRPAAGVE
jgi:hypothetical protein